jgi:hypothetical protein
MHKYTRTVNTVINILYTAWRQEIFFFFNVEICKIVFTRRDVF